MVERVGGVRASAGFASEIGPRERNEDFAGAVFGHELPKPRQEVVAAIADGIGGAKGGRIAAETAVRGFLDGFCDLPETLEVQRAAARVLDALNGWIHSPGSPRPRTQRGSDAPSQRWCSVAASRMCFIPVTRAPTGSRTTA